MVMAAFYGDENFALEVAEFLREYGHAATTTAAEGRLGAPDPHQLLFAAERGWTLITHNRHDFRLLHDAWHLWSRTWGIARRHAGILVLEQVQGLSNADKARLIHEFVTADGTSLENALYDWKPAIGWQTFRPRR